MSLTPRELASYLEGAGLAESAQWRRTMWGAWHVAAFMRSKKKLPALDRILRHLGGASRRKQSTEEMLQMVEQLNAAFGGKDLRKKKDLN